MYIKFEIHNFGFSGFFFVAILYILSQLGKNYEYFNQLGKKICISLPTFFLSPFNHFSPNIYLAIFPPGRGGWRVKQKNIHPAFIIVNFYSLYLLCLPKLSSEYSLCKYFCFVTGSIPRKKVANDFGRL